MVNLPRYDLLVKFLTCQQKFILFANELVVYKDLESKFVYNNDQLIDIFWSRPLFSNFHWSQPQRHKLMLTTVPIHVSRQLQRKLPICCSPLLWISYQYVVMFNWVVTIVVNVFPHNLVVKKRKKKKPHRTLFRFLFIYKFYNVIGIILHFCIICITSQ